MITHTFSVSKNGMVCVDPPLSRNEPNPLELAIAKWKFIVEQAEDGVFIDDCGSTTTCALCRVFCRSYPDCRGCPVAEAGYPRCGGTPYMDFVTDPTPEHARAELEFLEGLRDE